MRSLKKNGSYKRRITVFFYAFVILMIGTSIIFFNHQAFGATTKNAVTTTSTSTPPSFANQVLHWTQMNYHYTASDEDPMNGQAIIGDIWVVVGSDGIPTLVHFIYVSASGAFLQESVQTSSATTMIFGSAYPHPGCQPINQGLSRQELLSALPSFRQASDLSPVGFQQGGNLNHPFPVSANPVASHPPIASYPVGVNRIQWHLQRTFTAGTSDTQLLMTNAADDRILMKEVKLFDSIGTIQQDNWSTYGTVFAYNVNDIPTSLYTQPTHGGC